MHQCAYRLQSDGFVLVDWPSQSVLTSWVLAMLAKIPLHRCNSVVCAGTVQVSAGTVQVISKPGTRKCAILGASFAQGVRRGIYNCIQCSYVMKCNSEHSPARTLSGSLILHTKVMRTVVPFAAIFVRRAHTCARLTTRHMCLS